MTTLLEAKALTKHYGNTIALESVDFEVQDGITGLLGPNGAGKSTAIKLFLGLLKPTAGSAEVMGQKPYESVEIRSRLGYMPEHDCLPTSITASEFLTHMAQVSGLPPAYARTRAADILRHVGLEEERYRPIGQYSTGMKQRVKQEGRAQLRPFLPRAQSGLLGSPRRIPGFQGQAGSQSTGFRCESITSPGSHPGNQAR